MEYVFNTLYSCKSQRSECTYSCLIQIRSFQLFLYIVNDSCELAAYG